MLISVILPVYNAEKFISECLQSLKNQTFKEFELIIIDDGSTDNSLSIINSFVTSFQKISIISRENRGLVQSLNEGISQSSGKYIVRMDADDICHETRLEKQITKMTIDPSIDILGSWVKFFDKNILKGTIWRTSKTHREIQVNMIFGSAIAHPSLMIKSEIFKKDNYWYNSDYKGLEDYELWTRLMKNYKTQNLQEVLLFYRRHEESTTVKEERINQLRQQVKSKIRKAYIGRFSNWEIQQIDSEILEHLSSNENIKKYKKIETLGFNFWIHYKLILKTSFSKYFLFKSLLKFVFKGFIYRKK